MKHIFIKTLKAATFTVAYLLFASMVLAKAPSYSAFTVKVTGKGQPMLLIPGATCSGDEWNETVARYSNKYECHVFTMAGYAGAKPLEKAPYLNTFQKELEQYISDKKLDKVILVGHSIGGFLSLCIASEMRQHLQKVVVVDAFPFFAATFNPNAEAVFSEAKAEATFANYVKMDDATLRRNQMGMAKFLCLDSTRWNTIADWGAQSDKKTMAYTMNEMMASDMRQKISTIQVPVLVLAAYNNSPEHPGYTREMVTATFKDQYKACKTCNIHVAEDKTKHFVMFDNPKWYFAELDNFLKAKP